MKRAKAVLFDLYDTLVYADSQSLEDKLSACARICAVKPSEFSRVWRSFVVESNLGRFPTTEERVREVVRTLGLTETPALVTSLTRQEHEFLERGTRLFVDAISTLVSLRQRGLKLALVTNASPSVHIVLRSHRLPEYVDAIVVSCEVGSRKPDPGIYRTAMEELKAEASEGVFVGDGNDGELDGAHSLGMATIWIRRGLPKYVPTRESVPESIDFTVESLSDVVRIIDKEAE